MGSSDSPARFSTPESMWSVRSASQSSSMRIRLRSKACLTRASVSVRFATVIITGGVLCPISAQSLAVTLQS